MSRPVRCRKICSLPDFWTFAPEGDEVSEEVFMTLDELETIRLMDCQLLTQEECSESMGVARTTVTAVYESARRKIADCLVHGKRLVISGGAWSLVNQNPENLYELNQKGDLSMRIAVTYENGAIFQHFGHTEQFKVYDVEDGKIISSQVIGTNGQGHGALAGFLKNASVDILICGGIGGGAQIALKEAGIQLFGGVSGAADDAVKAYLEGNLSYNPDVKCNHHGEHHGEGHSCGGGHSCH